MGAYNVYIKKFFLGAYNVYIKKFFLGAYNVYIKKFFLGAYNVYIKKFFLGAYNVYIKKFFLGAYNVYIKKFFLGAYTAFAVDHFLHPCWTYYLHSFWCSDCFNVDVLAYFHCRYSFKDSASVDLSLCHFSCVLACQLRCIDHVDMFQLNCMLLTQGTRHLKHYKRMNLDRLSSKIWQLKMAETAF